MTTTTACPPPRSPPPRRRRCRWHRRMFQSLLYGRNVDRAAKTQGAARPRHGRLCRHLRRSSPARLVLYAVAPESRIAAPRRSSRRGRDRAPRPRRPQRRDPRDRSQGPLAVRRAAADHRSRRGARASDRRDARPRHRGNAPAARLQARLRVAQARDHAAPAAGGASPRHSRRIGFLNENKRVYPERQRGLAPDRPRQRRQSGHRRHGEVGRHPRPRRPPSRRLRHRPRAEAGRSSPSTCASSTRCATSCMAAKEKFKAKAAAGLVLDVRTGEIVVDGVGARLQSEQSERGARSRPHQPADHRRLRDGLDLQGADHRHGARHRQGHAQLDLRRPRLAALRPLQHQRLSRPEPHPHGAGGLHLFLERRRRENRLVGRRRGPQGVPAQGRPARPAAHRVAGERASRSFPSAGASSTP